MNFENIMQTVKATYCMITFMSRIGKSIEIQWLPGPRGKGELGVTANGYVVSFWDDEYVLELGVMVALYEYATILYKANFIICVLFQLKKRISQNQHQHSGW